jgi:phosphoserine aminotransferase
VENEDMEAVLPWLDWAFATVKAELLGPSGAEVDQARAGP